MESSVVMTESVSQLENIPMTPLRRGLMNTSNDDRRITYPSFAFDAAFGS